VQSGILYNYIHAKESLLTIKMIKESSVLQMHMAIHFSAAEKREFKQKKIRSVSAINYTGNIQLPSQHY
jgi:hypothetical protein